MFHHKEKEPEYGGIKWVLSAGMHTLSISGRSEGFSIDRIHLHQHGPAAKNPNWPESERVGYPYNPIFPTVVNSPSPAGETLVGKFNFTYEKSADFPGNDLAYNLPAVSADDCAELCATEYAPACVAFTWYPWSGGVCYPKKATGARVYKKPAMSGYLKVPLGESGKSEEPTPAQVVDIVGKVVRQGEKCKYFDMTTGTNVDLSKDCEEGTVCKAFGGVTIGGGSVSNCMKASASFTYVGVNDGGVGCCRMADGSSGHETLTLFADVKTSDECAKKCDEDSTCVAFEVSSWEGCELHSAAPAKATTTPGCFCMRKGDAIPAPEMVPPPSPAPTTLPVAAPVTPITEFIQGACVIIAGWNYNGFDIPGYLDIKMENVGMCAKECENVAQCTHFTYIWGGCYLKTSTANQRQTSAKLKPQGMSGTCTKSAPTADDLPPHGCKSMPGVDLYGFDIPGKMNLAASDADECADLCAEVPACKFFTYIWKKCFLKTEGSNPKARPQGMSGDCTRPLAGSGTEQITEGSGAEQITEGSGAQPTVVPVTDAGDADSTPAQEFDVTSSAATQASATVSVGFTSGENIIDGVPTTEEVAQEPSTISQLVHGCKLELKTDFVGHDIPGQMALPASTVEECATLCNDLADCAKFSWVGKKYCFLKSAGPVVRSKKGWVTSGICTHASDITMQVSKKCTVSSPGTDFRGGNIRTTKAETAEDCAALCEKDFSCSHFSHGAPYCHLKKSGAGMYKTKWLNSGTCVTVNMASQDEEEGREPELEPEPEIAKEREVYQDAPVPGTAATPNPTSVATPNPTSAATPNPTSAATTPTTPAPTTAVTPTLTAVDLLPIYGYTSFHAKHKGCCRVKGGLLNYSTVDGVSDALACELGCSADSSCNGYEFNLIGNVCELHHTMPNMATQNAACICKAKGLLLDELLPATHPSVSSSVPTPAPSSSSLDFSQPPAYTELGGGCCRLGGPTGYIPEKSFSLHKAVKSEFACKLLCDMEPSCLAIEISPWNGCELHTLLVDATNMNQHCHCFRKSSASAPMLQPEFSFESVGVGCCRVTNNGGDAAEPEWVHSKTDVSSFSYEACKEACFRHSGCMGFEHKVKSNGSGICRLSKVSPAATNGNHKCECMAKISIV
jgi:hypothetical protein